MQQNLPELLLIIKKLFEPQNQTEISKLMIGYQQLKKNYDQLKDNSVSAKKTAKKLNTSFLASDSEQLAYLLARMPATFAVATKVLTLLSHFNLSNQIESLLDLGSGTGAIIWAAIERLEHLTTVTAVEQNTAIVQLAHKLSSYAVSSIWQTVTWHCQDFIHSTLKPHDLSTLSYVLIEQDKIDFDKILAKLWQLSQKVLIIIEPGTVQGYANCLYARNYFINLGGFIAAPCSHHGQCPIKPGDWCHFTQRIERSYWQRFLKQATLGYEDEAYSYLIVTKERVNRGGKRIVKPIQKRSGHLRLDLCQPTDLATVTISRSQKQAYKLAKKKNWGDSIDL